MNIREAVTERIAKSGDEIASRVVDLLAEETLKKRVQQITQAMTESDNLNRDLKKMKPDIVTYNADGSRASESFSKKVIDDRNKAMARIKKVEAAITKALDTGDYGDVASLGSKATEATEDDTE